MDIKMFHMGFGESILLYGDKSCLLVDCGSESGKRKEYFNAVKDELEQFDKKSLLITHFHSDHTNGINFLGNKFLAGFEYIYLPHIFAFEDRTLELLIVEYLLEAFLDRRRKSSQIWGCLIAVAKTHCPIALVRQGTPFKVAEHSFRALWPIPEDPESTIRWLTVGETMKQLQLPYEKIEKLAFDTKNVVLWMSGYNDSRSNYTDAVNELQNILKEFYNVCDNYVTSMRGSGGVAFINKEYVRKSYQDIKDKNETSIVFQTADGGKQILMTGDITPRILENIVKNDSAALSTEKKHYEIIKAPHHGTSSGYFDFLQYYDLDKIYISNGETTWPEKSRGKISNKYFSDVRAYSIVCHNTQCRRCEFACDNGDCAACCEENNK